MNSSGGYALPHPASATWLGACASAAGRSASARMGAEAPGTGADVGRQSIPTWTVGLVVTQSSRKAPGRVRWSACMMAEEAGGSPLGVGCI